MNSSPLRKEAILPRLNGIQNNILHLREFSALSLEEFTKEEILDRVEHHLRLALEGVFHIIAHILSRIPGARETEYKRMAKKLGEIGMVEKNFADTALVEMAGFRNRLTHFYADVKPEELYRICRAKLPDIETFLSAVKKLIQDPGKFGLTIA